MMEELDFEVLGDDMQAVRFNLRRGQVVQAEAGALLYMDSGVKMDTGVEGGLFKGLKRSVSGEGFFMTKFSCVREPAEVCFSGPYPGKITPVRIEAGAGVLCQRDAFLCSTSGVDVSIGFTKRLGAGFFGGEGFILQKLEGDGRVFLHSGGTAIKKEIPAGEELRVDTGCLVAFSSKIDYDIKFVGGVKSALFGGEGLFFANLKGPGKVLLQTLPLSRLADKILTASRTWQDEKRRQR